MIDFYVKDSNDAVFSENYSRNESTVTFEKICISHLRLWQIITITAYYNLLRFFRVIKRDAYLSYIMVDQSIISYAVCYPKSFKYPFMGEYDYQIGSVYTDPRYRKKGYSALVIENLAQNISCPRVWYLAESDNIPSIKLCKKLNFKFFNNGVRLRGRYLSFLSIYRVT